MSCRNHTLFLLSPLLLSGCVTGALANALAGSGSVYSADEDPELIESAVPFALKTMEGVLVEEPEHIGLLTALASGFVQYGYAFVDQEAHRVAEEDIDRSIVLKKRARKLYLRARGYALRGLESAHQGWNATFRQDPQRALAMNEKEDVPLLYWTAASWGLAISSAKDDPEVIADYPLVGPIARRALELDESWNRGTLHDLMVSLEAGMPGGDIKAARKHLARALELSEGSRAGPLVAFAESVCVKEQNAKEFHQLIDRALAIDVDARPADRLANIIIQRRAARLKAASEDLFLEDLSDLSDTSTVSEGRPGS